MPIILSPKRKKKKKLKVDRKIYFILGSVLIVLAGLIFLLLGSGLFKVEDIDIQGANTIEVSSLEKVINLYLDQGEFVRKRNNIFLVRLGDLREDILEQVPKLKDVELKRNLFKGLLVSVTEKEPRGIYCTDSCFYFDQQGTVYEPAPKTKGFLILNISDQRDIDIKAGDSILSEGFLESVYEADNAFVDTLGLSIEGYIIPSNSFDEFRARTEEGWLVYMTTDAIQRQIEDLNLFLDSKLSLKKREVLNYVDIRLEGRIYYKTY